MNIMGSALTAAARGRLEQLLTKRSREKISEARKLSRRHDLSFAPLLKIRPKCYPKKRRKQILLCSGACWAHLHAAASIFNLSFLQLSRLKNFPEVSAPLQCPHGLWLFSKQEFPRWWLPGCFPGLTPLLSELLILLWIIPELQILGAPQVNWSWERLNAFPE